MAGTGWAGALHRSELVALNLSDVTMSAEGAELRRFKTDKDAAGAVVALPYGADPRHLPRARPGRPSCTTEPTTDPTLPCSERSTATAPPVADSPGKPSGWCSNATPTPLE